MKRLRAELNGVSLAARSAGASDQPAILLLHGWPQTSLAWEKVLDELGRRNFALAFDLPGVGESTGVPGSGEKSLIADLVLQGAEQLGARDILIVGYDVGGMVAFAAARDHADRIVGAVVMNTVIPGIDPWSKVLADPRIWHFAFHSIAELPELLVQGHQRAYFDYFYDFMAKDPASLPDATRDAYAEGYRRPEALKAGFDWYRALSKDAEHNARQVPIRVPMLYLRGDADGRDPADYVGPLSAAGASDIQSGVLADSGEYAPEEAPDQLIAALTRFRYYVGSRAGTSNRTAVGVPTAPTSLGNNRHDRGDP